MHVISKYLTLYAVNADQKHSWLKLNVIRYQNFWCIKKWTITDQVENKHGKYPWRTFTKTFQYHDLLLENCQFPRTRSFHGKILTFINLSLSHLVPVRNFCSTIKTRIATGASFLQKNGYLLFGKSLGQGSSQVHSLLFSPDR